MRSDDRSEILRDVLDGEICKKQKRKGTFTSFIDYDLLKSVAP